MKHILNKGRDHDGSCPFHMGAEHQRGLSQRGVVGFREQDPGNRVGVEAQKRLAHSQHCACFICRPDDVSITGR